MNKFLKALTAAVVLSSAASASADVTIGGLTFPTNTGVFFETGSIFEKIIFNTPAGSAVGQELSGVGEIFSINNQPITSLCSGCELTYRFDQYFVRAITPTEIDLIGGRIRLFLDYGGMNFNPSATANSAQDLAAATDGTLFLTLTGHQIDAAGDTFIGTGANIGLASAAGNGSGLVDVQPGGGIASANFNTNSIAALFGGPADLQVGSSFSNVVVPHPTECPTGPECLAGSVDLRGLVIPEPSSIALVGLALLGVFASTKKRRVG